MRVRAGEHEGWGECEASPLTCIASFVTPMSHGVCMPVGASVLGRTVEVPADIAAKWRDALQTMLADKGTKSLHLEREIARFGADTRGGVGISHAAPHQRAESQSV